VTEAVIVATSRSPIGRAVKGSLATLRPDDLAVQIIEALMAQVPQIKPSDVEDLLMGCSQPVGEQGFNIARNVAILSGLRTVPGTTVNRFCSSSLQTIRMAAHAVRAGEGDCFIAAGVECVSRFQQGGDPGLNPVFAEASARSALRAAGGQPSWTPAEGLPDAYIAMGQTAENVAELEGITREEMDAFAAQSQDRALKARANGFFDLDITPVTIPDGTVVTADDCPRETTLEGLAKLRPAFRPDGRVTAGNACPLNDGAAAVMVMSDSRAKRLGLAPLARIVSSAVSALDPEASARSRRAGWRSSAPA
jgi:acetyl-CoA C-acetyltransferase